jgi:hypothetical protein
LQKLDSKGGGNKGAASFGAVDGNKANVVTSAYILVHAIAIHPLTASMASGATFVNDNPLGRGLRRSSDH